MRHHGEIISGNFSVIHVIISGSSVAVLVRSSSPSEVTETDEFRKNGDTTCFFLPLLFLKHE